MSVVSLPRQRLPDQVSVTFGPTDAVAESLLAMDLAARNAGIRLAISTDFEELAHVNRLNQADWYPLMPNFDPRACVLNESNAFWVKGLDAHGEVVLTESVRLYTLPNDTSLKNEIDSLRFYYDEPEAARAKGVGAEMTAPTAASMTGRVTYGGSVWIRSDYRGMNLARLVTPLSHVLALTRWYPDYHTCFIMKPLLEKGLDKVYGYRHSEYALSLQNIPGFKPQIELGFCWMTGDDLVSEVEELALRGRHGFGAYAERKAGNDLRT